MIQTNWSSEFERVWRSSHILTLTLTRFSLEKKKFFFFGFQSQKALQTIAMIQTNWSSEFERVWRSSHILTLKAKNPNSFFPRSSQNPKTRFSLEKKNNFGFQSQKALQTIAMIQTNWSSEFERVWRSSHILTLTLTRFSLEKKIKFFFGFQSQKALQTIAMIQTNWSSEFERVWRSSHILTLTLTRFSLEKKKIFFWISKPKSPSNYSNDTDELVLGVWARLKKFPYFNPNPNSFFPRKKKIFFGFQSQKALQTIAMIQTNWSSEFERVWRSSHILTLTLTRFSLEKKNKKILDFKAKKPFKL